MSDYFFVDFVRLLNEGERSDPILLSSAQGRCKVERVHYTLPGLAPVPIIEKSSEDPLYGLPRKAQEQASRLRHIAGLGITTPAYVAASYEPGLIPRQGRETSTRGRLFLEDITQDGRYPLIDFEGDHTLTRDAHCAFRGGALVDQLENGNALRETLAQYMATLARDGTVPRMDYFMVRIEGSQGTLYAVDVDYELRQGAPHIERTRKGWPARDLLLTQSGLRDPYGILERMHAILDSSPAP